MTTVIFDIDGVLADNSNFKYWYDEDGDFLAKEFAKDIPKMKVNDWAYNLLMGLFEYYNIVIITARREAFRSATEKWLKKKGICYDNIHFNTGKDHVIHKLDCASLYDDVLFIVEDSPEIVKAYREVGYIVLQPNHLYGDD